MYNVISLMYFYTRESITTVKVTGIPFSPNSFWVPFGTTDLLISPLVLLMASQLDFLLAAVRGSKLRLLLWCRHGFFSDSAC